MESLDLDKTAHESTTQLIQESYKGTSLGLLTLVWDGRRHAGLTQHSGTQQEAGSVASTGE